MNPGSDPSAAAERQPTLGILDDPAALERADPGGMLSAVASFPAQLEDGWRRTRDVSLPWPRPSGVAVIGMGGSAIGGDLVRGIWGDRLTVPVEVIRGYELPAWVGPESLVVASSYSGSTEETISALGVALQRRCPVAIITTGGPLADVARRVGLPLVTFAGGGSPRAAVGSSLAVLAGLLERSGVLPLDEEEVRAGAAAARAMVERCAPGVPTAGNPAKRLAWAALDRMIVIVGSGPLAPVARRWKAQINENGKATAVYEELPEASHNTVVGFEQPESLRDHLFVVILTSPAEHPRNVLRAGLLGEILETGRIGHEIVTLEGERGIERALAGTLLGDYASVYLAIAYGVDPTPVEVIDHLKARLAEGEPDEGEDPAEARPEDRAGVPG